MKILNNINNNIMKVSTAIYVSIVMAAPSTAMAQQASTLTAETMSTGISKQIPAVAGLLIGFFALAGLFFVGSGVMKLVAKGNPQGGGQQITASQIAIHIGAGTVLLTLAVIIAISRNSLFGSGGTGSNFDGANIGVPASL